MKLIEVKINIKDTKIYINALNVTAICIDQALGIHPLNAGLSGRPAKGGEVNILRQRDRGTENNREKGRNTSQTKHGHRLFY